jgi:D-glycero-alpha-D-manno-heptose-7-phosphate kinase
MIISKTPLRVSLFGGGTDFPQFFNKKKAFIIGGAIDKYIYITINNQLSKLSNNKIKLFYRKVEIVKNVKQIKHKVIKKLLLKHKINGNVELHIASDLPSFSGLGSSSSFSVGLQNLLLSYQGVKISKKKLAKKTIELERNLLNETVGYQDQIHSTYGGFNLINIYKNDFTVKNLFNNEKIKKLEENLVLVFTGITRKADNIEKKKLKRIKFNLPYLEKINLISKQANKILNSNNINHFDKIGNLLDQTWQLKKKLSTSVSNKKIDDIYNLGLKNGALGGKLLGAGAGGFILFYVKKKMKNKFKKLMSKHPQIDFKFINNGSKTFEL